MIDNLGEHAFVDAGEGDDIVNWTETFGGTVHGGAGNDRITGDLAFNPPVSGQAASVIHGDAGNDFIQASGSGSVSDKLFGDEGNDTIIGGSGADRIDGGVGNDTLTGNGGADTFTFNMSQGGHDVITDFDVNNDVINLSGFGSNFDALAHVHDTANGAVLDLGAAGDVTLQGVHAADLSHHDFVLS
ncbi:hypothetical protein [Bradyrhizobium sp. Ai1a-2]|uniref:calcium-binding protein n=1 Tax=Bradyrhizobium sp. Ai1a-2 TaxID=196490 RepID=UPI0023B7F79E|nr:hypothetical protein [Bradyrhizobium sp. Ai1a-2]